MGFEPIPPKAGLITCVNQLSRRWDLNPRPTVYETVALPTELLRQLFGLTHNQMLYLELPRLFCTTKL